MKSVAVSGLRVQASLRCATDDEREGNRESMGVTIVEMHSIEYWTLKGPHPSARKDPQWRINYTNQTKILSTENLYCLQEMQAKRWSRK